MKIHGQIYKITNKLNSKAYIGQTTEDDVNIRLNYYRKLRCKEQPKIYRALKKYGPENFLYESIDTTQSQSQLDDLEVFYISKFDTMHNGYNCDPGGRGGKKSEETKRKISKYRMGMKFSDETKKRMSEARLGNKNPMFGKGILVSGSKNGMYGKKTSDETKKKISEAKMGSKNGMYGKKMSDEAKKKISEAVKLRFAKKNLPESC